MKTGVPGDHINIHSSARIPVERLRPETTPEARRLAVVLTWFLLFLIVGTLPGVWIKLFWIGWVFLP
jgi:hypothetical protein